MKKVRILSIVMAMLLFVTSCGKKGPTYYVNPDMFSGVTKETTSGSLFATVSDPREKTFSIVREVFDNLSAFYGIKKDFPTIKEVPAQEIHADTGILAVYYPVTKTIYISDYIPCSSSDMKALVAHEIMHYFSDNEKSVGFKYYMDNNLLGNSLNEGVANYFSTKLYPIDVHFSLYEYETHIANLFAMAFGEEELLKAFLSSDIESLKADFNSALSDVYPEEQIGDITLTPFDMFANNFDLYEYNLMRSDDEHFQVSFLFANSTEEMLKFYCESKDLKNAFSDETNNFLEYKSIIPWKDFSYLYSIANS